MTLKYLLDTNILSEPLVRQPHPQVLTKLRYHQSELATCAPVWHELQFGVMRLPESKKKRTVTRYLEEVIGTLHILPYDIAAALWHGQERARLEALGQTRPFVDGQIMAIAQVNNLILVTRNVDDFRYFLGVQIENWFQESP